jgi:hypothetical protein
MPEVVQLLEGEPTLQEEPIGIVISRGSELEPEPRFRAYLWAEASEPEREAGK